LATELYPWYLCETLQSPTTNLCAYPNADILESLENKAKRVLKTSTIAEKKYTNESK
jgi:hypothetical protein